MTAPARPPEPAALPALPAPADRARILVYAGCLAAALCLHLVVHGRDQGPVAWAVSGAALAGLASTPVVRDLAQGARAAEWAALLATGLALAVPLGPALAEGSSLPAAVAAGAVWTSILVALFASRVLTELADLRFAAFCRTPLQARRTPPLQSTGAALALGIALTLLFYHAAGLLPPATGKVTGTVQRALLGDSAIHAAILFLFFVILAFVADAARLHARDGAVLAALRAMAARQERRGGGLGPAGLQRLVGACLPSLSHSRAIRLVQEAIESGRSAAGAARPRPAGALAGFDAASRRFVRGLVPLLTLLGFLGTVIGLAGALAELPRDLGEGGARSAEIGGTLAGLALKFETTLLGLLASMAASLALAALEKSEAEMEAACALLVEAAEEGAGSHAA